MCSIHKHFFRFHFYAAAICSRLYSSASETYPRIYTTIYGSITNLLNSSSFMYCTTHVASTELDFLSPLIYFFISFLASSSHLLLNSLSLCPFTFIKFTLCTFVRSYNFCHISLFLTGSFPAVFQLFFTQL